MCRSKFVVISVAKEEQTFDPCIDFFFFKLPSSKKFTLTHVFGVAHLVSNFHKKARPL